MLKKTLCTILLSCAVWITPIQANQDAVIDAMEGYLMFQEYQGATIMPQQIPAEEYQNLFVIDAREADRFEQEHIPGANHIEWREVIERRDEIPTDQQVLIYCDTGALSAQAGVLLRLAGFNNVRILQGGFEGWQQAGGLKAFERAMAEED